MKRFGLYSNSQSAKNQGGFTLMELLVSLLLSTIVFAGLMTMFSTSSKLAHDQAIRIATNLQVQAILQTIGSELRILGNGVPFDQANFQIDETTLSDPTVADPIVVASSTTSRIAFRLNETGEVFLLTANFDPAATDDIFLTDVGQLQANDPFYISNSVVAGDDGFYGIVAAVDAGTNKISVVNASRVFSPGATFDMGSVLEEVSVVTYDAPVDNSGITRDSGYGQVILGPNSTMTLQYLDFGGNPLTPPLTNLDLINSLRKIKVTVGMTSQQILSTGAPYTASAEQIFGLRNLNYVF